MGRLIQGDFKRLKNEKLCQERLHTKQPKKVSKSTKKVENVIKDPVEYNGVLNDKKAKTNQPTDKECEQKRAFPSIENAPFLLTIDWLQIHYKTGITLSDFDEDNMAGYGGSEVRIKLMNQPTQHFLYICEVYVQGRFLGMLQIEPRDGASYGDRSAALKIDNRLFYESGDLWYKYVCVFEEWTKSEFQNITRLDLALDTPSKSVFEFVDTWVKNPATCGFMKKGRARFSPIMTEVTNSQTTSMTSFKIGMPKSHKSKVKKVLTCYNKTIELKHGKKPYIEDYHYRNFGDNHGEVMRYEFRFSSVYMKEFRINHSSDICFMSGEIYDRYRGVVLSDLVDVSSLCQMYQLALKNFFEYCKSSGDKNISRRKVVQFFDMDKMIEHRSFTVERKKGTDDGSFMAKRVIKNILDEAILDNSTPSEQMYLMKTCSFYIEAYNLHFWVSSRFEKWCKDWDNELYLLHRPYPNYKKLFRYLKPHFRLDYLAEVERI